jgi:fatty acid desaturase
MKTKIKQGENMDKMETDKQAKRRRALRTLSWFVVALQVTAISWLLITLGVDKFTSMVWAVLFSGFTIIGMLLIMKGSENL